MLVKAAVQGEREDELFYDYLISMAPTQEEKNIITSIRDDERKHNKYFREIYSFYTKQSLRTQSYWSTQRRFYRQIREFTLSELAQFDGAMGRPAYVAVDGIKYIIKHRISVIGIKNSYIKSGTKVLEVI